MYIFTFLSGLFIGLRYFREDTFWRFDNIGVPEARLCVVDDTDPLSLLTKKIKYQENIGNYWKLHIIIFTFIDLSGRLEVDNYHVVNLFWLQWVLRKLFGFPEVLSITAVAGHKFAPSLPNVLKSRFEDWLLSPRL